MTAANSVFFIQALGPGEGAVLLGFVRAKLVHCVAAGLSTGGVPLAVTAAVTKWIVAPVGKRMMNRRNRASAGGTLTFLPEAASTQRCGGRVAAAVEVGMTQVMATGQQETTGSVHDRGLLLIGIFKLLKSAFFVLVGFGAFHLMNRDLGNEVQHVAGILRFEPEGRVVTLLMSKVDLITAQRLRQIGFFSFAYSALALTEGVGLLLAKPWAEYLTLFLTISFLPWELYELGRRPTWGRFSLLIINLLVLGYLVWLLRRKRLGDARQAEL